MVKNGFGFEKKNNLNNDVDTWRIYVVPGNPSRYTGYVKKIDKNNKVHLNPSLGINYSNGIEKYVIRKKTIKVPLFPIPVIVEETEENTKNYCDFMNKRLEETKKVQNNK